MADLQSLTLTVDECKETLVKASKTIRSLIQQRNAALTAADPKSIEVAQQETETSANAIAIRSELETARKDTEAAIAEAGNIPALPPKTAAAKYPKTLADGTEYKRPDVVAWNARDEAAARAAGFAVQVPPPPPSETT